MNLLFTIHRHGVIAAVAVFCYYFNNIVLKILYTNMAIGLYSIIHVTHNIIIQYTLRGATCIIRGTELVVEAAEVKPLFIYFLPFIARNLD